MKRWRMVSYLLMAMLFTEAMITGIIVYQTNETETVIRSFFMSEKNSLNLQSLSQSLMDLEKLALIDCLQLKGNHLSQPILKIGHDSCFRSFFARSTPVSGLNGFEWNVQYLAHRPLGFHFFAWVIRIAVFLTVFSVVKALDYRQKIAQQEREKAMAISRWSRRIGHDLRSPLSALNLSLSSRGVQLGKADSVVKNALIRMDKIANTLLSEDSATSKGVEQKMERVPLSLLEKKLQSLIRDKLAEYPSKALRIVFEPSRITELAQLQIDPLDFERHLSNILTNSIEANVESKETEIHIQLDQNSNDRVSITVTDNGPGFPKEIVAAQGQKILSLGKSNGHGLGISGVFEWTQRLGGSLHLSNRPEGGAMLIINLPTSSQQIHAAAWAAVGSRNSALQ